MFRLGMVVTVLVVAADQISKITILNHLDPYERITITPFFNLVLVYNTGIGFGLFARGDEFTRWALLLLTLAVALVLPIWLARTQEILVSIALGMILGGAFGNMTDRLVRGAVVDFLDFHIHAWHWPAFNVADSSITIGVVLFFITSLLAGQGNSRLRPK